MGPIDIPKKLLKSCYPFSYILHPWSDSKDISHTCPPQWDDVQSEGFRYLSLRSRSLADPEGGGGGGQGVRTPLKNHKI